LQKNPKFVLSLVHDKHIAGKTCAAPKATLDIYSDALVSSNGRLERLRSGTRQTNASERKPLLLSTRAEEVREYLCPSLHTTTNSSSQARGSI